MKSAGPRSLKGRALQWLAQREHSRLELRRKLLPHAEAEDESEDEVDAARPGAGANSRLRAVARVDALLDWLEAHRYLSEQRFAEARIHTRSARFGNLRIRQELAQHGVDLTDEARVALQGTELDRARSVWQRRFGRIANAGAPTATDHAKQARFLTARGFSPEVVRRVLREAAAGEPRIVGGPDSDPD